MNQNKVLLSDRDSRRVEEAVRKIEARARAIQPFYRRRGRSAPHKGGSGSDIHLAYCKEDASDSNSIACFLSYPELNVRVWLSTVTYITGHVVTHENKFWLSKDAENLNHTPAEGLYWEEILDFDESIEYSADDYCLYSNKLWRCKQTAEAKIPTEGTYWTTKTKDYSSGISYVVDDRVTYNSKVYRCIQAGSGRTPDSESSYWAEIKEIEVFCNIACGKSLQFAFPRLLEQQEIEVKFSTANNRYEAKTLFQAAEETAAEGGMLEMATSFMTYDRYANISNEQQLIFEETGVGFNAAANSTYVIEVTILYRGPTVDNTDCGIKLGWLLPDTFVSFGGYWLGLDNSTMTTLGQTEGYSTSFVEFKRNAAGIRFITGKFVLQTDDTAAQVTPVFKSNTSGKNCYVLMGSSIQWRRTQYSVQAL